MEEMIDAENAERELSEQARIRREKLNKLTAEGQDPFRKTKFSVTARSGEVKGNFEAWEGKEVSVAGRLMSRRVMGNSAIFS